MNSIENSDPDILTSDVTHSDQHLQLTEDTRWVSSVLVTLTVGKTMIQVTNPLQTH